jgi:hypothetical protein
VPLTPAHAAAAWPISRFLRRLPVDSLTGIFVFCLPVGLVVWIAYRLLVRPALVELLPPPLAGELTAPSRPYAPAALAIMLGALSHLAWDSFTHGYGWFVGHSGLLRRTIEIGPLDYPAYRWLQHISSVVGLLIIFYWIVTWLRRHPPGTRAFTAAHVSRITRIAVVLVGIAAVCAVLNGFRADRDNVGLVLGYVAVGGMDGLAIGLLVFGSAHASRSERPA